MKTGDEYRSSLIDGREVYVDGARVASVTTHPVHSVAVDRTAEGYDRLNSGLSETSVSPLHVAPDSAAQLRRQYEVLRMAGLMAHVTYTSTMTMTTAASSLPASIGERIGALVSHIREHDLRLAQCITDAKGDRSRRPAEQADPDSYLRVVDRDRNGVVIRGAKLHISGASICHELLVMPTKRMRADESEYSVACLIPVATDGVRIVDVSYGPRNDPRDYPVSSRVSVPDGFVIFDDVYVPHERIMLDGDPEHAALFAHSLGLWERLYGLSSVADEADVMVGLAQLIAEANGVSRIPHVRSKIAEMILQATMIRAALEAAIANCVVIDGSVSPDELFTNAGKHFAVKNYTLLARNLQDIAGGSTATAPRSADLEHPVVGHLVRKYMTGSDEYSAELRLRLFHAIRDISADTYGGWKQVARLNGGGGLFAQETVTRKHYDIASAKRAAMDHIGLTDPEGAS